MDEKPNSIPGIITDTIKFIVYKNGIGINANKSICIGTWKPLFCIKPQTFFSPCALLTFSGELEPNCFINSSEGWKIKAIGIVTSNKAVDNIKIFNALLK